jgi:hypothetical protein
LLVLVSQFTPSLSTSTHDSSSTVSSVQERESFNNRVLCCDDAAG